MANRLRKRKFSRPTLHHRERYVFAQRRGTGKDNHDGGQALPEAQEAEQRARVAPEQIRVRVSPPTMGITTQRYVPAFEPRQTSRSGSHKGKPLFVLGTARRRRALASVRRGGYYSLSKVKKTRGVPRSISWPLTTLGIMSALIVSILLILGLGGYGGYLYVAQDLPSIDNIHGINFETTRIYDRHGKLLYEMFDPQAGKRSYVRIDQMPATLINATIATEDSSFNENNGVDPQAMLRAIYINYTNKGTSGASTITQQLVRSVLLPEHDEQTPLRKIREAILAVEMTQKYSKEKILEIYLNEIYYGSLSYGVAAAAETYFGKQVSDLDLAQSAMLAGLPQAPGDYDPNRNFDLARARQKIVLDLMTKGKFITRQQADDAYTEDVHPAIRTANVPRYAPHFVEYVRQELEKKYGLDVANRGGLKVFTTVDLDMQAEAQRIATAQIENIKKQNASNAALVAIDPRTGEILAMLGSVDYTDPLFGEVNVATAPRQPGSSFKPITYATAFQRGDYNPSSILPDLPAKYTNGAGLLPYIPQNYDGRFHGPVSIKAALANSYNIPAVEMLQAVGVPAVLDTAHRMGITTLNDPTRYGLALTLGGGEVKLVDMTSAFSTFANYGTHVPTTPFLKIVDASGKVLEELNTSNPGGTRAIDAGVAYQISEILSDNVARTPAFGPNSALKIDGMEAAVKTGTTNDWKDSWTIGYTPALAVGVWVGNNDGRPMSHVAGAIGAAPIWHNFIQKIYSDPNLKARLLLPGEQKLPDKFVPQPGMIRAAYCPESGMAPTSACTQLRYDWFTANNQPHEDCNWHEWVSVTLSDGGAHLPGPGVPAEDIIQRVYTVPPEQYKGWVGNGPPTGALVITATHVAALPAPLLGEPASIAQIVTPIPGLNSSTGKRQPGLQQPGQDNAEPIAGLQLQITSPVAGQVITGPVQVMGQAQVDNFGHYRLEFGFGSGEQMTTIADSAEVPITGALGLWDASNLTPGPYLLRLTLTTADGQEVRRDLKVRIGIGAPAVVVQSPADGASFYKGDQVTITANPDVGGTALAGVELYVDGQRIASLTSPPWSATWTAQGVGPHSIIADVYTTIGEEAQSNPVPVTVQEDRATPLPTKVPIMWISKPTLYKELPPGVNEVWVEVNQGSPVQHVDIYMDGRPVGFATGPGFRVNPKWTPTPSPVPTRVPPAPTATLDTNAAATATTVQATEAIKETQGTATMQVRATRTAKAAATKTARAAALATAAARQAAANATDAAGTALVQAATTSPTPRPPTDTPQPAPTATFVRYEPLLDPMLGDFVAHCQFPVGKHRIIAIGYNKESQEVGRDETWIVVK
ncbi:MAG: PBP1A family penicillin-binding protein [Chloroflexota bacterium]|nr:PBP1A family penicillin-binding protein [Chloroflexota bacterium]